MKLQLEFENNEKQLQVSNAQSFWQKFRGLSFKKFLKNDGMLFSFKTPCRPQFWMWGMSFKIDIVWINENRVVGWVDKISHPKSYWHLIFPYTLKRYRPESKITHALEITAGKRQEWRIDENTKIKILP